MSFKHGAPLRRTRKVLSRIPLSSQLAGAAVCGALAVLVIQLALGDRRQTRRDSFLLSTRPEKLVVVAAGLPRTGSTWIFNVLRILVRIRDPNSVAGWYADLINIWKNHKTHKYDNMKVSWLEAYKSLNTSIVLKMHGPGPFKHFSHGTSLGDGADLTVITHRDLRSEVRSWVYQNWNGSIHSGDIQKTPFADPAQWLRVAEHILKERKNTLASIGTGNYLDIRYEEWNDGGLEAQVRVAGEIAAHLKWRFSPEEIRAAAVEAARLEAPADGAVLMYNPVNKLHPGHTRLDASDRAFQAVLQRGYKAIETDAECRKFMHSKGYL